MPVLLESSLILESSVEDINASSSCNTAYISGVNPKVVQERLGHSRVAITLDLYSHVNEDLQVEAAIRLENDFFDNGDRVSG